MSRRFTRRAQVSIAVAVVALIALSCADKEAVHHTVSMPTAAPGSTFMDQAALSPASSAGTASAPPSELSARAASAKVEAPEQGNPSTFQAPQPLPGTMLIRNGQASVQVDSLEVGLARIREMARRTGAVIANTSMQDGRDRVRAASLELRIPSERFDDAVNGLSPIGKLESVNVSVQDVGEEFVDVTARMVNARRLEQRLIELLANRTGKLADVLRVESELARVRQEIERYEGRLRYLRARSSVSTLTIGVHEPYPIVATRPGERPIRDAFVQAWRNFVGFTASIIASLGVILPLGLIVALVVLLGKRIIPGRSLRLAADKPSDSG